MIIFFTEREDSNSSERSSLGEGLEGRVNLLPDKEFRERNDALRIDNGKDEEGTAGSKKRVINENPKLNSTFDCRGLMAITVSS